MKPRATDLPAFPSGFVMRVIFLSFRRLCLETVIAQTDGEPVTRELKELPKLQQKPTRTRTTSTHSSRSNGSVESAIGHLTGQVRTLREQLVMIHGLTLNPNMCNWPWLTRPASWSMNLFSVCASGRTAYEEASDTSVLGETVFFREL